VLQQSAAELQSWFESRMVPSDGTGPRPPTSTGDDGSGSRVMVESLEESRLVVTRSTRPQDLRPGAIVSGPALMGLADAAGWLMVVAHLPPGSDAVTVDVSMQFLRPAPAAELSAEVQLLRLGGRTAVVTVALTSALVADGPVAHAVMTFATRPPAAAGDSADGA
jgi:uncharacterized protein (TIGR00369 family)